MQTRLTIFALTLVLTVVTASHLMAAVARMPVPEFIPMEGPGISVTGSLKALASENPKKTSSDHSIPTSQAACKRTLTTSAALTPLLVSVLTFPEISGLGWDVLSTGDEPDDKDQGCCYIGKNTGGMSWEYVTWGQCKNDAKQIGDPSPDFKKGEKCPDK